jgi:hypothetical protein
MTKAECLDRDAPLRRPGTSQRDVPTTHTRLQMCAGLGRGTRGQVTLALRGLLGCGVGGRWGSRALSRGFHLRFGWRLRRLLVSLGADSYHLPFDELVAAGMNPRSVDERPPFLRRRRRNNFRRIRRIGLQTPTGLLLDLPV